jgi:hypothetical protein
MPAIPISGKFKVLHGFDSVLAALFSCRAHFHPPQARLRQAKTALFGATRFRAPATLPLRGRRVLLRNPYNRLRGSSRFQRLDFSGFCFSKTQTVIRSGV